MWQLVGATQLSPATGTVTLGMVEGPLSEGLLPCKCVFSGAADLRPLSFGVLIPVAETDDCGLPSERVYPQLQPVMVNLGPGVGPNFVGRLMYKLRNYNANWLRFQMPARTVGLEVFVWLPSGSTGPVSEFRLFIDKAGRRYSASDQRVGPKGAAPLTPND